MENIHQKQIQRCFIRITVGNQVCQEN